MRLQLRLRLRLRLLLHGLLIRFQTCENPSWDKSTRLPQDVQLHHQRTVRQLTWRLLLLIQLKLQLIALLLWVLRDALRWWRLTAVTFNQLLYTVLLQLRHVTALLRYLAALLRRQLQRLTDAP